jgi:hypothetical protein
LNKSVFATLGKTNVGIAGNGMIALGRDSDIQRISQKELRALWANHPGEIAGIKRAGISTPSEVLCL